MANCTSMLTVRKKDGHYVDVPCGVCLCCRKRKAAALKRLSEYTQYEYFRKGSSCSFNCLTYSPRSLPLTDNGLPTLRKSDFQKFFKRFRINVSRALSDRSDEKKVNLDFKYLACGEYGDDHLPHYHFIAFGLDSAFVDKFALMSWRTKDGFPIGRIDCRPLTSGGVSYVCDYVITALNGQKAVEAFDDKGIERPFFVHSKGLGVKYLLENADLLVDNNFVDRFSGRPFCIPKYYRDYYRLDPYNAIDHQPFIKLERVRARRAGLSVSAFQVQQSHIASKNALLSSREQGVPALNEFVSHRVQSGSEKRSLHDLAVSCVRQDSYIDDCPF